MTRAARAAALALAITLLAACQGGRSHGAFVAQPLRHPDRQLRTAYPTAVYAVDEKNVASVYLSDLPLDRLAAGEFERGQVLHLRLLWVPRAGRTPLDPSAINASVEHVVLVGDEVGVYGGAGFVVPGDRVGRDRLSLRLAEASLDLLASTERFRDVLSPAVLGGAATARRDEEAVERIRFVTSQIVTNRLGRTTFVETPVDATSRRDRPL